MCSLLLIGYGNELRRDDGLGPKLASAIGARHWPGVQVITCQQLTPELAEPISKAQRVVFIDACLDRQAVSLTTLSPAVAPELRTHTCAPSALLTLAQELFCRRPQAWWLTLPATDLQFGEELSKPGQAALREALDIVERTFQIRSPNRQA